MAWELRPLIASGILPEQSVITCLDQEPQVLEALQKSVADDLAKHNRPNVVVNIVQASFVELFDAKSSLAHLPLHDIICSIGLLDYMTDMRARAFVTALYNKLAPGGLLVVTHIRQHTTRLEWILGYMCDWEMYYRTKEQMREMAADASDAIVDILTDPKGNFYIMTLRRPG